MFKICPIPTTSETQIGTQSGDLIRSFLVKSECDPRLNWFDARERIFASHSKEIERDHMVLGGLGGADLGRRQRYTWDGTSNRYPSCTCLPLLSLSPARYCAPPIPLLLCIGNSDQYLISGKAPLCSSAPGVLRALLNGQAAAILARCGGRRRPDRIAKEGWQGRGRQDAERAKLRWGIIQRLSPRSPNEVRRRGLDGAKQTVQETSVLHTHQICLKLDCVHDWWLIKQSVLEICRQAEAVERASSL
jgi:hypothetical protein